jgi:NADPH:quinone reductase-like Zn-dependent oxidoreductase
LTFYYKILFDRQLYFEPFKQVETKPENLETNLKIMNPGGRIILLGPHEDQIQLYLRPFLTKEVYLTGVNLGNASVNDLLETARFLSDHRK